MIYGSLRIESNHMTIQRFAQEDERNLIDSINAHVGRRTSKWFQRTKSELGFRFSHYLTYDSLAMLRFLDSADVSKPITLLTLMSKGVIREDLGQVVREDITKSSLLKYFEQRKVTASMLENCDWDMLTYGVRIAFKAEFNFKHKHNDGFYEKFIGAENCSIPNILRRRMEEYNTELYTAEAVHVLSDAVRQQRIHELVHNTNMQKEDFVELGKLSISGMQNVKPPLKAVDFLGNVVRLEPEQKPKTEE